MGGQDDRLRRRYEGDTVGNRHRQTLIPAAVSRPSELWKKPAPLTKDWLFERINDGSGRTAVTDLRALSLGLIADEQEVEKF